MIDLKKLKKVIDDLNECQVAGLQRETDEIEQKLKDETGLMAPELVTIGYNLIAKHLEGAIRLIDMSEDMVKTVAEAQDFLDEVKHTRRVENQRLIREFKEPTDIVIYGGCYDDDYKCDVKITDDYSGFSISCLGKHKNSLDCEGFVTILTLKEFIKKNVQVEDGVEYALIKNFQGTAHLLVSDGEGKSFETINLPVDKFLHWECGLANEDDDGHFYPQVEISLSKNAMVQIFYEDDFESIKEKYIRKSKLDDIEKG